MSLPVDHCGDDPWMVGSGSFDDVQTAEAEQPVLQFDTIDGVEPLDAQFGVFSKKTVPDVLYDALFGLPKPTANGIETTGSDVLVKRPIQTYAILEAAKIMNLPELLTDSGLEHRCLFKGDAYDELKDVAPWIVRLEDGNGFTRSLFTTGDAPWHLWDAAPALYLRSRGALEQLWKHFRKFTRIRNEAGKWFYFRFWEAGCLIDYLRFAESSGASDLRPLFGIDPENPSLPLVRAYISAGADSARVCAMPRMSGHNAEVRIKIDMSILRFLAVRSHAHRFAESFFEGAGASISKPHLQKAKDMAAHLTQKYHGLGFRSKYHLGSFTYWALALNADFETRTPSIQVQIRRRDTDPNDRFVVITREMKALYGPRIRNYHGYGT